MTGMAIAPSHVRWFLSITFILGLLVAPQAWLAGESQGAQAQAPAGAAIPGIRNFTKVDPTIACGGALALEAFPALKQAGYKSVVNLRGADEPGANVEEHRRAAAAAGLTYIHLPFTYAAPDATKLDEFLKAVVKPENTPMMLHCASGNRVSVFWAVKRVMIDGWFLDKAMSELAALSMPFPPSLRTFMLDYLKSHGKGQQ